jgi:phospholipid/cholesterol/gamma-HCH transport system ATP-binding protein
MTTALREPGNASPLITVRDLWTRFDEFWIHHEISLEVQPGESLVIIGGSGSGKSTLLRMMIGLQHPERGEVVMGGLDVVRSDERALHELMRRVGVLFQFGALFDSLTVWENVTFGLQDRRLSDAQRRRAASEKLKMVGLRGVEDLLPGQLSGGMKKRVGLARAIAHDPDILLCDEPTSGLDPVMSDLISELILQMNERLGVTTVTITHDIATAYKIGDRIAMLYDGTIRVCDTPEKIRETEDPIVRQFIEGQAHGPIRAEAAEEISAPSPGGAEG